MPEMTNQQPETTFPSCKLEKGFLEPTRRIITVAIACFWWLAMEKDSTGSLLGTTGIDLALIGIAAFLAQAGGAAWQDSLLWGILSRRIHLDAMGNVESLPVVYSVSFTVWIVAWAAANRDRTRSLLLAWHLGLSFDPGFSRTAGLGMAIGWEAAPLNLLLLTASLQAVLTSPTRTWFGGLGLPAFTGAIWLLALHGNGATGQLTCSLIATGILSILFLGTRLQGGVGEPGLFGALALGTVPIFLVALVSGWGESSSLMVFLQKRLSAGSLHPNLLGAGAMTLLLLLASGKDFRTFPASVVPPITAFVGFLALIVLCGSGSRVLMALFLVGGTLMLLRGRLPGKKIVLGILAVFAPILVWRLSQSAYLAEWTLNERFFIWESAFRNVLRAPMTGFGVLPFGLLPQRIDPLAGVWVYDWNYPHSHALVSEILLWGGIPLLALAGFVLIRWIISMAALSHGQAEGEGAGEAILPCLLFLSYGMADFIWFTPSLLFLGISIAWIPIPGEVSPRELPKVFGEPWKWVVLLLAIPPMVGVTTAGIGFSRYSEALAAFRERNPAWVPLMDKAILAAPLNIDFPLQRLLWKWSAGVRPAEGDNREVSLMIQRAPDFYLPWFLRGRLESLKGEFATAAALLEASVNLEPRDSTGIRWANLALARIKASQTWEFAGLNAIARPEWGSAMLLDHPDFASRTRECLASCVSALNPDGIPGVLGFTRAFSSLARRGVGGIAIPPGTFGIPGMPAWLDDLARGVEVESGLSSGSGERVFQSLRGDFDRLGIDRLTILSREADRRGDFATSASAARRVGELWNYRNKNNEDVTTPFFLARSLLQARGFEEARALLDRLDALDPRNPFIFERRGDLLASEGDREGALREFQTALQIVPSARLDPFFSGEPRNILFPCGDHWTFMFERALRRFDPDAPDYHWEEWEEYENRLEQKLKKTGEHSTSFPETQ